MKKVAFFTLGCKVNQVETESMIEQFERLGFEVVDFAGPADVYIINSCTVTRIADKKSQAVVRRARRSNPEALVVLTGCWGQIASSRGVCPDEVDLLVPNNEKETLAEQVKARLEGREYRPEGSTAVEGFLPPSCYSRRHRRTRGFIKIQDGCEQFCSYCIVPYARGPVRCKRPEDVIQEIRAMIDLEYKEIVLTGIHIGVYGQGLKGWDLERLLKKVIQDIPGNYRLRLGSLEPLEVTRGLRDMAVEEKKLCRHFHIPLQSGSRCILEAMNRRYEPDQYKRLVEDLARAIPMLGLTTDVMVGFPGEGEKEFMETYRLIEDSPLSGLHVFKYSSRPGTPAAVMSSQVPEPVKHERSQALIELGRRKREEFLGRLVGKQLVVLAEEECDSGYLGLSDNYAEVLMAGPVQANRFYRVEISRIDEAQRLCGLAVSEETCE